MDGALYTSVTPGDLQHLRAHHPEATWTEHRLAPSLASAHADTRVLAVMVHDDVTWDALARFEGLRAVVTRSDGHDHLPLDAMRQNDVTAYHLEGYATRSVAELAVMSIIAGLRRVPEAAWRTRSEAGWDREGLMGRRLDECTVGLLGTGRIGGEVARLLSAWGAQVVCHDLEPDPSVASLPGVAYVDDLDALLRASDALSLHVPLTEETRGLIDARALACLPDDAVVVNTARGDVVDQEPVLAALDDRLGGYVADVLPGEPSPPVLPELARHPKALLTPHLGAHTKATVERRFATTARICHAVLEGREADVAAFRIDETR